MRGTFGGCEKKSARVAGFLQTNRGQYWVGYKTWLHPNKTKHIHVSGIWEPRDEVFFKTILRGFIRFVVGWSGFFARKTHSMQ